MTRMLPVVVRESPLVRLRLNLSPGVPPMITPKGLTVPKPLTPRLRTRIGGRKRGIRREIRAEKEAKGAKEMEKVVKEALTVRRPGEGASFVKEPTGHQNAPAILSETGLSPRVQPQAKGPIGPVFGD